MAFKENIAVFFNTDHFAVTATYKPYAGQVKEVNGIFDREYVDVGTAMVPVEGYSPVFRCAESDVSDVAHDDELIIGDKTYLVKGVQPDGTGEMLLVLEEQD